MPLIASNRSRNSVTAPSDRTSSKYGVGVKGKGKGRDGKTRLREYFHIFRRLLVLAAALWYIYLSLTAATLSLMVLRGVINKSMTFVPYYSTLIPHYVGESTMRSDKQVSFTGCGAEVTTFNAWTYNNSFMRQNLADMVAQTSYNLTFLADAELIAPVVDCTSDAIVFADDSAVRVFYLMRSKRNHDDVYMLTSSLSTQDYMLSDEHQLGATASITLTYINDVRDTTVKYYHVMQLGFPFQTNTYQPYHLLGLDAESFWELESIPKDPLLEASKVVRTACRTGFYTNAETEQCNVKNLNWGLATNPLEAMRVWDWTGYTTVRDSWAWVHGIHYVFALETFFNLAVLVVVVYRNARQGKIWVGDAFVSVSAKLTIRAVLVLLSWYMNGFWTLMEFCLKESNELAAVQRIFTFPEIIHADLLALYLGLAGALGYMLRERIDPALAVVLFELGFQSRRTIALWFPKTMEVAGAFAYKDYLKCLSFMQPKHTSLTPMRLWTMHELDDKDVTFILATLFPVFISFVLVVAYVPIRKVYRRLYPERKITRSHLTGASSENESLLSWKGSLTIFEVATGAPLQNRVGLVTDYDNCIYIKGMKFASADGIYCNGYVIVSGKWLVSTDDLLAIFLMVVTRIRFKNVYVYEVTSHTVQQTARLVYPETMRLADLIQLNVSVLS